ncbi:GDP/GTP exchange factor for ARF [Pleurotus ostreatus]|uniref:GDP/GTP exchange factor for ARF n=1 Tax=Pleurotus ostreatus TaxID=5322 RepID=A0A8H7AA91_PLEOS|nr:GDP/GTP exchange factor for ARF [Pleurotus ostreatus]KAF7440985.1 GDP/GTP exchange factor for ARF [Pleurotus ostreatus]
MSDQIPRGVSTKHVLHSEILLVTSAMRRNSRWATTTHFMSPSRDPAVGTNLGLRISSPSTPTLLRIDRESDLMAGFQDLKRIISEAESIDTLPLPTLLAPFLAIIRSPLSTGPITSSALSSLHHFFVCGLISTNAMMLDTALGALSSVASHCKFEASDSSSDEIVILRIMTVIHDCLCGPVGQFLGDVEVCEMLETVLTTCCQMRLSETLRRFAENILHGLIRAVFLRLASLNPVAEEAKLREVEEDAREADIRMNVSSKDVPKSPVPVDVPQEGTAEPAANTHTAAAETIETPQPELQPPRSAASPSRSEYGLPSILELLRVLINVLDPTDQQHTDSTRLVALGALNIAFEESGSCIIRFPSLEALIVDHGCKFLFQLARSDNPYVLQAALRTNATVFDTMRPRLKLQLELFLAFTMDRLAPAPPANKAQASMARMSGVPTSPYPSTPILGAPPESEAGEGTATPTRVLVAPARGETRDQILETLSQLSRKSSFMVDLYSNYDCDINCENMFERLIDFLTKSVYSSQYAGAIDVHQKNAQYLCLDMLLTFVNDMATRADGPHTPWPSEYPEPAALMEAKSRKQLVLTGASRFNTKPKTGLNFLEENKLIYADLSADTTKAQSLAKFLKGCSRLDKRLLGDFISKPDNIDLLHAFLSLFDFKGKHIADAMREMLEAFRLPGEAQQISRITETFASIYFATKPEGIQSEDAVYVLAYSVILLNTDQHNPQVQQNIYDSIRKREIVMPEEHTGQLGFEYAWKELLARSRNSGELLMCNSSLFDVNMFKLVWKPVVSAIAYAFISFDDDYIIQRAVAGFRQCATLASRFNLPDVFDFVVVSLSQATGLLSESLPAQVPNYPVVEVEGQAITVSTLSVKFGTNFKGQLAAVVLFNIVNGNGNALREGWTQIFEMFQNLFLHSLLPTRMLQMEDFLGGVSMIPLRGSQPARQQHRNDTGLLSALSSYLMTPYGSSSDYLVPDATESDVENTLCTIDCITSCRLDELYSQIMQLDSDALVAATRALEALAHERTVARFKQESDDGTIEIDGEAFALPYDPASVFLLETMASIACQNSSLIDELWPIVFEHLSAVVSSANHYSVLLVERAIVAFLRLCLILATKASLRDQVYVSFDLLAGLPANVAAAVAEQVVSGVVLLMQKYPEVARSQTEWNIVFALLRSIMPNPEASRLSFEFIVSLASDGPNQVVTPDSFAGLVMILDDFATAAGKAIESQQTKGRQKQQLTSAQSPIIERGRKAVDLISELKKFMSVFLDSNIPQGQVWYQYCFPLMNSLGRQSTNAAREVRYSALSQLQRLLLGPYMVFENINPIQVEEIFNRVLFPLLDDLVKPQVNERDPQGMPESRLRAATFLCKAFMHFEVRESQADADIRIVWIQVLDLLDRLMNVDKSEPLYEAVPESLKNVLLVMNAAGLLVPPPSEEDQRTERQRTVWTSTHERMERFLPGFLSDVIPPPRTSASAQPT